MEAMEVGYSLMNWAGWAFAVINPVVTFFVSKWLTKREKKEKDIQIISTTVTSSVESINKLTDQIRDLVEKLCAEQDKNLELLQEKTKLLHERTELNTKIDKLQKEVSTLTKKIDQLRKKQEHEN